MAQANVTATCINIHTRTRNLVVEFVFTIIENAFHQKKEKRKLPGTSGMLTALSHHYTMLIGQTNETFNGVG